MTQQESTDRNSAGSIILVTMLVAIGYAVLRYHIVGPVPWKDFPFLVLNKGLSLGAFILLTFNFALGPAKNLILRSIRALPPLRLLGHVCAQGTSIVAIKGKA